MAPETDCLFCGIIAGRITAKAIYQDDRIFAFEDINPQAPHHALLCPRKHISTLNDVTLEDEGLLGHLVRVAADLARRRGVAEEGYRLVANCQRRAGQSVFHIHFHLLAGRHFSWPPG